MTPLDRLNLVGSVSEIVELAITIATFLRVGRLSEAIRQHFYDGYLVELFDKIESLPAAPRKTTLPAPKVLDVESLIHTIEVRYSSRLPWRHGRRKQTISDLKAELLGAKNTERVRHYVKLLRGEILVR